MKVQLVTPYERLELLMSKRSHKKFQMRVTGPIRIKMQLLKIPSKVAKTNFQPASVQISMLEDKSKILGWISIAF